MVPRTQGGASHIPRMFRVRPCHPPRPQDQHPASSSGTAGWPGSTHGSILKTLNDAAYCSRFIASLYIGQLRGLRSAAPTVKLYLTLVMPQSTGCEDGSLQLWDCRTSRPVAEIPKAHATRIRGVAAVGSAASGAAGAAAAESSGGNAAAGRTTAPLAASASSDGTIRLWDLRTAGSHRWGRRQLADWFVK